jgi:Yip1-like protein/zinc ribbon protein
MHCGQCGKSIDADSKFCTNCGAPFAPAADDKIAGASAPPVTAPPPPPTRAGPATPSFGASASGAAASAGAALSNVDAAGIIARAKNILLTPRTEWPVISAESRTSAEVWMGYVAPLVAISAIAGGLGMMVFGITVPLLGTIRVGPVPTIAHVIMQFVMTFVGLFVLSLIINALAPTFGGQKDSLRALKTAAYSFTPAWVGGLLTLFPALGIIAGLIGLYGLYLLYLGLPVMMRSAQEKAVGYTAVVVLCAIVISIVVSLAVGAVLTMMGMGVAGIGGGALSRSDRGADQAAVVLSTLMGGKSDADKARMKEALGNLQKMGEQAEKAQQSARAAGKDPGTAAANSVDLSTALAAVGTMASGGKDVKPVDFHALKDLLPQDIAGLARREASGQSGEAAGMKGSSATARYTDAGNASLTLEIADLGSLSGLAGLATKFNPNMEKETDSGFERTRTVNGQMLHQKYDRRSKSGEYDMMIANRFTVTAHGNNISEDALAAAVKSVDVERLAALAK